MQGFIPCFAPADNEDKKYQYVCPNCGQPICTEAHVSWDPDAHGFFIDGITDDTDYCGDCGNEVYGEFVEKELSDALCCDPGVDEHRAKIAMDFLCAKYVEWKDQYPYDSNDIFESVVEKIGYLAKEGIDVPDYAVEVVVDQL